MLSDGLVTMHRVYAYHMYVHVHMLRDKKQPNFHDMSAAAFIDRTKKKQKQKQMERINFNKIGLQQKKTKQISAHLIYKLDMAQN